MSPVADRLPGFAGLMEETGVLTPRERLALHDARLHRAARALGREDR